MKSTVKNVLNNLKGAAPTADPKPIVDYPQAGETIAYPQYTARVAASATATAVDVSIDKGPWQPCRQELGLWWYDWSGYASGDHEIVARTKGRNGRWLISPSNRFKIAL